MPLPARARPRPDLADEDLTARIAALETELRQLKQQQRLALIVTIASRIAPGVVFSARELWRHQVVDRRVSETLGVLGIRNARQLGRRLQQLEHDHVDGAALLRVGRDHTGILWTVQIDSHRDACRVGPPGA
jgi:hypothetical protein